ncbi:MAG: sigma-70 family RNA polymerase sigma factor [Bacteroidales bacterium]
MQPEKLNINIEKLYSTYSDRLYFTSLRIVGNSYDAEEIMQDTFIKYYNYPNKTDILEIQKWLSSICIRKSIDVLRAKNRNALTIEEYRENNNNTLYDEGISLFEEENDTNKTIEKIKTALNSLPDRYRLILSLHLFEGYDYSEIEHITGIKENSIRSIYMRGKAKLAELLQNKINK